MSCSLFMAGSGSPAEAAGALVALTSAPANRAAISAGIAAPKAGAFTSPPLARPTMSIFGRQVDLLRRNSGEKLQKTRSRRRRSPYGVQSTVATMPRAGSQAKARISAVASALS